MAQVTWGHDSRDKTGGTPVVSDLSALINGHMLIVGASGTGKTHTLRRIANELVDTSNPGYRVLVYDIHGDIDMPNSSTVMFSEQTKFGMNPLRVNPDPHFGGPRKQIQALLYTLDAVGYRLGDKQKACLRNILTGLYREHGILQDDPSTWIVDEREHRLLGGDDGDRFYIDVPFPEKDQARALGASWDRNAGAKGCWYVPVDAYKGGITRWPPKRVSRCNPTMEDALRYARRKLMETFLGSDKEAVTNLEIYNRAAAALRKRVIAAAKSGETEFKDEATEAELEKLKGKALDTYKSYIDKITSGDELEALITFDSVDVLKGVVDRLENLAAIGIFKADPPPFDPSASVWRYDLRALSMEERKLFVLFSLKDVFLRAVQRGETDGVVETIILDEAHVFADDDPDNILNNIAREARKFGLSLICASQSPTHFPEDFIAAVATKVILGIDEMYWRTSVSKMRVTEEGLKWIRPQTSILVQTKRKGNVKSEWQWTYLPRQTEARRMAVVG